MNTTDVDNLKGSTYGMWSCGISVKLLLENSESGMRGLDVDSNKNVSGGTNMQKTQVSSHLLSSRAKFSSWVILKVGSLDQR